MGTASLERFLLHGGSSSTCVWGSASRLVPVLPVHSSESCTFYQPAVLKGGFPRPPAAEDQPPGTPECPLGVTEGAAAPQSRTKGTSVKALRILWVQLLPPLTPTAPRAAHSTMDLGPPKAPAPVETQP